ncbi:hypothetical protein Cni_G27396 [Canna indica]|uniref:Serine/threonine protein phosphatase 2A regulatory subunit n=1 Tax=Canna indica TaxID=4628 RepID=A0AAQ3QP98_9LILI|nr:hypothetical protein Cni_G27396 [Canna indica]
MGASKSPPPKRKSTTLRHLFDLDSVDASVMLPPPPEPRTSSELLSSISACSAAVFTFTDPWESPTEQDLKRRQLSHILAALRSAKGSLDDAAWPPLVAMLAANLFRPLPPPAYPSLPQDLFEEDGPMMTLAPDWPHLHIVYDILAAAVAGSDAKTLRRHIDRGFLRSLLALFQSEDPRERDRLKNVYHNLYSKLAADRGFMRKQMSAVLLDHVLEADRHCGIGELLEIWGSIINGFSVPLKEEHRTFLARVLLPLHKPKPIAAYHRQLSYCVTQFVQKDAALGEVVVRGILRHWPVTNCQKEVLLLGEIEDLVESLEGNDEQLEKIAVPLCARVARSSNSTNSQVAERALYVWNSEQFVKMASQSWEQVIPGIVECVEKNLKWHWSKSVQQLTASVKKMLQEMEPELYARFLMELEHKESLMVEEERKRKMRWENLEMAAKM